jgi:hypothetical protein
MVSVYPSLMSRIVWKGAESQTPSIESPAEAKPLPRAAKPALNSRSRPSRQHGRTQRVADAPRRP